MKRLFSFGYYKSGDDDGSVESASPNANFCGFSDFVKSRHLLAESIARILLRALRARGNCYTVKATTVTINEVTEMGEITNLNKATSKNESLRTTVPRSIINQFGLTKYDKL